MLEFPIHHRARATLAGLALAAWTLLPSARAVPAEGATTQQVERLLAQLSTAPEAGDSMLARQLTMLGSAAVPGLFDRLVLGANARLADPTTPRDARSRRELDVILGALAGLPRTDVRAEVALRLAAGANPGVRAAAMLATAAEGRARELDHMLSIANPALDADGFVAPFDACVADACSALARRDDTTWPTAAALALRLDTAPQLALLRAAGEDASEPALDVLGGALRTLPGRRLEVLAILARTLQDPTVTAPRSVREAVVELLRDPDPMACAQAAIVAGRLEAATAVPQLVELVDSDSQGVRENAAWALSRITGLGMRTDGARWRAWLADEHAWFDARHERAREELRDRDAGVVRRAVLELGRHRLDREQLVLEIAPVLLHGDVETASVAAATIGALRSRSALACLRDVRDRVDPKVREAVDAAIASVEEPRTRARRTGLTRPGP